MKDVKTKKNGVFASADHIKVAVMELKDFIAQNIKALQLQQVYTKFIKRRLPCLIECEAQYLNVTRNKVKFNLSHLYVFDDKI